MNKLVIGPFEKGLQTNRLPFNIDNDSFPVILNAYQWRGRVKRKRGTELLCRLERHFISTSVSYSSTSTITLDGSGNGNLLTGFSLQSGGDIVPGTVTITHGITNYTDPSKNGTLSPSGSINYATGDFTIASESGNAVSAVFNYYPKLPAMGLREFNVSNTQNSGTIGFDTVYAYRIDQNFPYLSNDVSWYKNPPTGTYPGYTQKTNWTPVTWNGQNYQQFWTINYENAFWVTNGITQPFTITNIGLQFKPIVTVTVLTPTTASLQIIGHGLVVGDFIFVNEVQTTTGINFQTGYVTTVTDANNIIVTFPEATLALNGTLGIAQYLTNRSDVTKDCIRWFDGDPTNSSRLNPVFVAGNGWVNFMPPLSQSAFSIGDLPPAIYYLAGARMIVPFKDRLLFIGCVVQAADGSNPVYLQDTIICSQNGTPYYTASFTGDVDLPTTEFFPILTPTNQNATANAYFTDQPGFGYFLTLGTSQQINTTSINEDMLILGFDARQARLVYSGNDIVPFNVFIVNSEYGSTSTFSAINTDDGVFAIGTRGITITSQTQCQRIDLPIPDQIFEFHTNDNGLQRVSSQRDFINEWIYFTYTDNEFDTIFPNQTLLYNYRDNTWSIFRESYTCYGPFLQRTGLTWATVGDKYPTWADWNDPWNSGSSTVNQPQVIVGNQQGFIFLRNVGTTEEDSLYITSFSGNIVTCTNHCLNDGDYIIIQGCLGTIAPYVNNQIFSVSPNPADPNNRNTFQVNPDIGSGTYLGGGYIVRMYNPFIQTKQFPVHWNDSRKTRIGAQRYLLTSTEESQITLLIYLSQNASSPYNIGPIIPGISTINSSLIYSTILYTCPESTNLGLTPANSNLMTPTALQQDQIWHRVNTSLIGDTIQLGFTMSDAQMRSMSPSPDTFAITGATQANPCVLTCAGNFPTGTIIFISGVVGMLDLNGNNYYVVTSDATTVTIFVDSTFFIPYISGGTAASTEPLNQFAEIELHGIIMDVSPSQMLV